jgi:hypothetical protein
MLDDDQIRNRVTSTDPTRRQNIGAIMVGVLAIFAVLALVWMWAPWRDTRSAATNTGTTVGSSPARPETPTSAPAEPSVIGKRTGG